MASVDDIFKSVNLPSKRKLEVSHDPAQFYKSAKHSTNGDAKGGTHATVEDEEDEDMEAGPEMPPDDAEEDYGTDDDEDGRFFGGGVGRGAKAAMEYLDEKDGEDKFVEEKYDVSWVRKLALAFEKRISKNAELRARFESEPQKFMTSEADLDSGIKELSILSEHPELYEEFAKLDCVASLVSLLAHENADIAIDGIEIINELIDEDVEATEDQWNALVNAALDADMLNLLVQNFERLDESQEADRGGVYNSLSILESLASQTSLVERIGKDTTILKWLLERAQKTEPSVSQNKLYAAELLSILVQSSTPNRTGLIDLDAVDVVLQLLAPYRRADPPKDSEEQEFIENLFDALTCLVDEPAGKAKFTDAEGVELALIMIREGKLSKQRAIRLLDHAAGTGAGVQVCDRIVEAQGLKTLFGVFMKKHDPSMTEHFLGVFSSMLRNLPGESATRIRLLAKFVEKEYEKIDKLVSVRKGLTPKLDSVSKQIAEERKGLTKVEQEEQEADWLSRRLEAGLFSLQTVDVILAWLIAEDQGARKRIVALFKERDEGLGDIEKTLREQLDGVVDTDEEAQAFKEMLSVLLDVIKP